MFNSLKRNIISSLLGIVLLNPSILLVRQLITFKLKKKTTSNTSLYQFLKVCVIEQRGNHSLVSGFDKDHKKGSLEDIEFLQQYVKKIELLRLFKSDETVTKFLNEIKSVSKDQLTIHLTRDCQIFETGNHYVSLNFRIEKDLYSYNLVFTAKFKQSYGSLPDNTDSINITYIKDYRISKNSPNYSNEYTQAFHIIDIDDKYCYSRHHIGSNKFNINDKIINELVLPEHLRISNNYVIKAKTIPDACNIM